MAGEAGESQEAQQALWNEVAEERKEAEESPSDEFKQAKEAEPPEAEAGEGEKVEEPAKVEPEAKKPEPEADPYEGLSPALKARLQMLDDLQSQVAQIPQLVQTVKTAEGRVAAMQRELDVSKNAAKAVGDAPTQTQIAAAAASTEKWDALKADFPEWADATEQFVKASLAGFTPQQVKGIDPEQVGQMIEQRVAEVRAQALQAVEEARVDGKHPNWRDEVKSDDFKTWFAQQPATTQQLYYSESGRDAIRMLDLFQESKAKPAEEVKQERAAKLAAAVSSKPGSSPAVAKTVDQMSPEELWDYERKRRAKTGSDRGLTY